MIYDLIYDILFLVLVPGNVPVKCTNCKNCKYDLYPGTIVYQVRSMDSDLLLTFRKTCAFILRTV